MRGAVPDHPRPGPTPRRAVAALVLIAALVVAILASLPAERPRPGAGSAAVTAGIVEGMRHGDGYYALAAGGRDPGASILSVPMPTLAVIAAALPWRAVAAMLWMLAGAVVLAWQPRLRAIAGRGPAFALVALIAGCAAALRPGLALAPELWAGLFLALSLARWRPGDAAETTAFAAAAALLAPAAAAVLPVMAGFAWREGARREAAGWLIALLLFAGVFAVHLGAVPHAAIDAETEPGGALRGFGFAAAAIGAAAVPVSLPAAATATLVALSVAGWAWSPTPTARRVTAALLAAGAALALLPGADDAWALLVAPIAPVGLAGVPGMLRTLVRAALDRRRITVRRVVR